MFDSIVLYLKEITINLCLNVKINNEKRSALYDLISLFFCRKSKPFNDQHHQNTRIYIMITSLKNVCFQGSVSENIFLENRPYLHLIFINFNLELSGLIKFPKNAYKSQTKHSFIFFLSKVLFEVHCIGKVCRQNNKNMKRYIFQLLSDF